MAQPATELTPATDNTGAVLIPVKAFAKAKGRLGDALTSAQRAHLAQAMATHVVQAQRDVTVAICCDDAGVAAWAQSCGASVIWTPDTDLNGAVQAGVVALAHAGYRSTAIAHSDLPRAGSLAHLIGWPGITIVPDRHRTGSNVVALPTDVGFTFRYGAGSFMQHVAEAAQRRLALRIVHDDDLAWDVDNPADLLLDHENPFAHLIESTEDD